MQKRNRWQLWLIVAVIALTIYNILPTVFYYTKPLKESISQKQALDISTSIAKRVNSLEQDSLDWVHSFCKLLKISPSSVEVDSQNPGQIFVNFSKEDEAKKFASYLPRAGALIPFSPAQLSLASLDDVDTKKVAVQRNIFLRLDKDQLPSFFQFAQKQQKETLTPLYQEVLFDRLLQIGLAIGGQDEKAIYIASILDKPQSYGSQELLFSLAHDITESVKIFGKNSSILDRFFASFSQGTYGKDSKTFIEQFVQASEKERDRLKLEKKQWQEQEEKAKESNAFVQENLQQNLQMLERKTALLISAESIVKNHVSAFTKGEKPWDFSLQKEIQTAFLQNPSEKALTLDVGNRNPFIKTIILDIPNEKVLLKLHDDVLAFRATAQPRNREQLDQLLINEIARISRKTDENIAFHNTEYVISLNQLTNSSSFLALDLSQIAKTQAQQIQKIISHDWHPKHQELSRELFPVVDYATYQSLPLSEKKLCLVVYAPIAQQTAPLQGMKANSIYIVAKGLDRILQKYQSHADSEEAQQFLQDFQQLKALLQRNGFLGYSASFTPLLSEFSSDYIFEKEDCFRNILLATREQFHVHGTKKFALLEFSNVEQRILVENQIETRMHEDLLKWQDEYNAAKVSLNNEAKYDVPAPTKSVLWNNFVLSSIKYFRGDDRKILHWGLDLSGGKTVQIELRDQNNKVVSNEIDLKQGINELYNRVNKMGVSEVSIRMVDKSVVLDFPGSQGLSATDLVKASTMYFHVVNEKFSTQNTALADSVNRFLQEVWNEAVVTNKKDIESINLIAWKHLYGETLSADLVQPQSESAKILYDQGFRLASNDAPMTGVVNDALSKIAIFRGTEFSAWHGQTHPLLIVFNNYALEGTSLENIRAAYDPSKGNFLSFEIKGAYTAKDGQKINPRETLYGWTSQFSKEKVSGTPLEVFSKGHGWRMAVILNDTVINAPNLESALRDSAMITGGFSQREINQLASDLKAGSLSFTPKILSEKNVSPELGQQERFHGILAMVVALIVVIICMIAYYRFAGLVASVAVLFNLLIMWATLQNLQATLTLAGIAGVILTVAMAVDANVLVFERIKEEFAISQRISSAIMVGYKKAFSAIFDSNITTIIAALILLHFDAGPIKGFAVTLIIGIISSMFTALFMTKFFFARWVQNPEHQKLTMSNLIRGAHFNFLKTAKYAISFSLIVMVFGSMALVWQGRSIIGMDFLGGFSLSLEVEPKENVDYRQVVEKALLQNGASLQDFQIRELTPKNNLRILFGTSMEEKGKPFYELPLETSSSDAKYAFSSNPRILWVVNALNNASVPLTDHSLSTLQNTWSAVSGQMSDSMRNNALFGLLLSFIAIFIYITFRFEFKFAASAIVCLFHDVLLTIASMAVLHIFGMPLQIDMHTIAALMTIIGYSLNDTIIIFDRIREDVKLYRSDNWYDIVNRSLNTTLSRTTITTGLTLIVLIILVILGGSTIFSFAFTMTIGMIFGTLSSLYIASPLMLALHNYEVKKAHRLLNHNSLSE